MQNLNSLAGDPWARLNAAIQADTLEKAPKERHIAPLELERVLDLDNVLAAYGDCDGIHPPDRRWPG